MKAQFHVEPQWDGRTKVCSNDPVRVTEVAAMRIYGKNPLNSSSLKPTGRWPLNLVYNIGDSDSTEFVQMIILG